MLSGSCWKNVPTPVSYTHLDVYKRQESPCTALISPPFNFSLNYNKSKILTQKAEAHCHISNVRLRFNSAFPTGFEPTTYRLGELCGSVNPCQELICLAFYYQGLFLFSNQILVIWIPFLSRPDKTWKLADSLQLLTSGESSVVTDRYHIPATIPLQAGMINNIQLTRFLLLLYNVIVNLSMGMCIRDRQWPLQNWQTIR